MAIETAGNLTNGDVIKAMFPKVKVKTVTLDGKLIGYDVSKLDEGSCAETYFTETFWNAPYKAECEEWEDVDKGAISEAVKLLDLFTKTFCRYRSNHERFDDLRFRCNECPFQKENGECLAKVFKNKFAPDYRDFGCMGDL